MTKPSNYLPKYFFEWDLLDIAIGQESALDAKFFVTHMKDRTQVSDFLSAYGFDPEDPINRAELFGNFQEALQFVKRYFLKEGNPGGLDFPIPEAFHRITDIEDVFLISTGNHESFHAVEEKLWAEILLKVMHTILHVDKDLRTNYLNIIQQQILDRFYKYLFRRGEDLFIGQEEDGEAIEITEFESRPKKARDSTILKLLHKAESAAEELFDRIGIRVITKGRFDTLRIIKFFIDKNIILPHNVRPSRTVNTMIDLKKFRKYYRDIIKGALRENLTEEEFLTKAENCLNKLQQEKGNGRNEHSFKGYRSIHFTNRQLIKYRNPFFKEFNGLRQMARQSEKESELSKKILGMDISLIAQDVRFFYPYEIQIVDEKSHQINTEGEASHAEYKKSQIQVSRQRLFKQLLEFKGLDHRTN